ncbi:flippase-like domain-containing protein [Clostridium beijerinckii]|nr:flippase-like domain-containing protein [Clostridium beijerinckii]MBC2421239.1 flippase-like domain-containing protein [Clostridium beijerinckii]MBC2430077.1 flippase-like domain-containing protein [Clostridium beijerinckii]MBC2488386.1 flippase-like domain-containing protein [Clostridium beijerinckii]MBC2523993.1 flippase-like domain-containing protein [Clostridium beijerinckii]
MLILAILLLLLGHYFKMLRWRQFVEIYEKPQNDILLKSLIIGYMVNFCLPFRIGDLIRSIYAGRKMKNGIGFSIATVIVDKYLDVIVVGFLFLIFYLGSFPKVTLLYSLLFYLGLSTIALYFLVIAIKYSRYLKILTKKISSIFNDEIELNLLHFSWSIISVFKDMYKKVSRKKLIYNTVLIWLWYITSYYLFATFLSTFQSTVKLIDVFNLLFNSNNIFMSTIRISHISSNLILQIPLIMGLYILTPLIALYTISILKDKANNTLIENDDEQFGMKYLKILPHVNKNEKLEFLEAYFSGGDRDYFKRYIEINRNISIINDYSSGSNATTMLCTNGKQSFFRKYAFGNAGEKLYQQIRWLHEHENFLSLPKIISEDRGKGYCYYDMLYDNSYVGFFNYVHSMPIEDSWSIMKKTLNELEKNLYYINIRKADKDTIKKYIDTKVIQNIEKIKNAKLLKNLIEYDELIINGIKYKNLNYFSKYLTFEYLYDVFKEDKYSDIHGDLTIENLICRRNGVCKEDFYIIDPNTGNLHDSSNLDYSKLLQSLHGGYEFLMNTRNVDIIKNNINYLYVKSSAYNELYERYKKFLNKKFTYNRVKSIFFHEIIHWLRLMPYKVESDSRRVAVFYAGLIIVMNEIIEMYEEN